MIRQNGAGLLPPDCRTIGRSSAPAPSSSLDWTASASCPAAVGSPAPGRWPWGRGGGVDWVTGWWMGRCSGRSLGWLHCYSGTSAQLTVFLAEEVRWIIVLVYTTRERRDLFVFFNVYFFLAWKDDRLNVRLKGEILRWKQFPKMGISLIKYCPISRDSEPIKLRHLRRFTCFL